ncbi:MULTISPECIES: hypothetical protein [unclassified Pseudoalteromonas]|uniref:hypothetical protein n=1 Tax=unclassified Pseudoalteromonas TaxID=194690 RepID=UPI0011090F0B|nr:MULTISPECIES: hypothetical protein [unclassified Pseudoalteromonas]
MDNLKSPYWEVYIFILILSLIFSASILLILATPWYNNMTLDMITKIFAAAGSLATFLTFIYLIIQNSNRIKFEEQQSNSLEKQNEMLNFQKYQLHRAEFYSLLETLEDRNNGLLMFQHKDRLYKRLFPENSFSYLVYDYSNNPIAEENPLELCKDAINRYKNDTILLKDENCEYETNILKQSIESIRLNTNKLQNLFNIIDNSKPEFGSVLSEKHILMNCTDVFRNIETLIKLINEIRMFTNLPEYYGNKTQGNIYYPIPVSLKVIRYLTEINSEFSVNGLDILKAIIELDDILKISDNDKINNVAFKSLKLSSFLNYTTLKNEFNCNDEEIINELKSRLNNFKEKHTKEISINSSLRNSIQELENKLSNSKPLNNENSPLSLMF